MITVPNTKQARIALSNAGIKPVRQNGSIVLPEGAKITEIPVPEGKGIRVTCKIKGQTKEAAWFVANAEV